MDESFENYGGVLWVRTYNDLFIFKWEPNGKSLISNIFSHLKINLLLKDSIRVPPSMFFKTVFNVPCTLMIGMHSPSYVLSVVMPLIFVTRSFTYFARTTWHRFLVACLIIYLAVCCSPLSYYVFLLNIVDLYEQYANTKHFLTLLILTHFDFILFYHDLI